MDSSPANDEKQDSSSLTPTTLWLRILHINDVYELDNFPSFKTLVDEKSSEGPDKTLVLLGGDFLGPSLLSSLNHGWSMVDCMNAVGITHVCFGNHECDVPSTALAQRIAQSNFVWLNSNMQDLNTRLGGGVDTPVYDIVTISSASKRKESISDKNSIVSKRVALLGFLTDDPALYRPGSFSNAKMEPVVETARQCVGHLLSLQQQPTPDLILPVTHQSLADDRKFGQEFVDSGIFPLVLGGHDHIPFDETVVGNNGSCCCRIFKTGYDAIHTGIIDIQWKVNPDSTTTTCSITAELVDTNSFPPNPGMVQRVKGHKSILLRLQQARLFRIDDWTLNLKKYNQHARTNRRMSAILLPSAAPASKPSSSDQEQRPKEDYYENKNDDDSGGDVDQVNVFSTANNRLGPSTGTTALATMLRMGMQCHVCLLNAGSVRGNQVYCSNQHHQEYFSWQYLKTEMPFVTAMTVTALPGSVIEATIRHSRRGMLEGVAMGGFIHTCNNVIYNDETQCVESILDQPLDPDREYLVTHPLEFFDGIDNHEPLLEWAAAAPAAEPQQLRRQLLDREAARPAKLIIVELFSALLWLHLGSFDDLDVHHQGYITRDDLQQKCAQLFQRQHSKSTSTGDDDHDNLTADHDTENNNNEDGNKLSAKEDDMINNNDLIVDNVWSVADVNGTGRISPLDLIWVHLVAADLVHTPPALLSSSTTPLQTQQQQQHCPCDLYRAAMIRDTVARVLNRPPDSPRVQCMIKAVERRMQQHHFHGTQGDNVNDNQDGTEQPQRYPGGSHKLLGGLRRQSLL